LRLNLDLILGQFQECAKTEKHYSFQLLAAVYFFFLMTYKERLKQQKK